MCHWTFKLDCKDRSESKCLFCLDLIFLYQCNAIMLMYGFLWFIKKKQSPTWPTLFQKVQIKLQLKTCQGILHWNCPQIIDTKKNLSYEFTAKKLNIAHTFLLLIFLIMSTTINFNSWHNNVIREGLKNNSTTTRWSKLYKLNSNFSFELILLSSPNIGRCQCWPRVVTVRSLPISSGTWHIPH